MDQETKINNFIENYKFDNNLFFYWLPWRWKTRILNKLYSKLPENESSFEKYFITDWQFREQINAKNMWLMQNTLTWKAALNYPFEMCVRAKVLFFDDLWASENISSPQKTKLQYILDMREAKNKITIFSTNLTPKEIWEMYWERIKSRLFNWKHWKGLTRIEITWEDRRRENIKNISL